MEKEPEGQQAQHRPPSRLACSSFFFYFFVFQPGIVATCVKSTR